MLIDWMGSGLQIILMPNKQNRYWGFPYLEKMLLFVSLQRCSYKHETHCQSSAAYLNVYINDYMIEMCVLVVAGPS